MDEIGGLFFIIFGAANSILSNRLQREKDELYNITYLFLVHKELKYRLKENKVELNQVDRAISTVKEELSHTSNRIKDAEGETELIERLTIKVYDVYDAIQAKIFDKQITQKSNQLTEELKAQKQSTKLKLNQLEAKKSRVTKERERLKNFQNKKLPKAINEFASCSNFNPQDIHNLLHMKKKQLKRALISKFVLSGYKIADYDNILNQMEIEVEREFDSIL
ncbi:MAG: hypothetical protein AAFQ91_25160 [Cyanobacteria bacterium J06621_15]